jgi:hypothetical protein
MILWHDAANGRVMRWACSMNEGAGTVDIVTQMKATLANANEDDRND